VAYKGSTRQSIWVLWLQNQSKQINPADHNKSKGGKQKSSQHISSITRKQKLQEAYGKKKERGGLLSIKFWQKTGSLVYIQILLYTIETINKLLYFIKKSDPDNG
jgi:hypothetical protein